MSGGVGAFTSTGNDDASLSGAFARNPNLHLFVGVNYYDLNAPFYATEYTLAHLNVSPEVRAHNITVSHYRGRTNDLRATTRRWSNCRAIWPVSSTKRPRRRKSKRRNQGAMS